MPDIEDLSYYLKELNYLKEQGARFKQRNPGVADHLGIDLEGGGNDPHANRIIESFAFLTGKLHRYLDAQFPELMHSLFQMLYPYYLLPIPAKTLVSMKPISGMLDVSREIPKGTELKTRPIGLHGHPYTFTTCWQTYVHPITVKRFYIDTNSLAAHSFSLELEVDKVADVGSVNWDEVDFLIHGEGDDNPQTRFNLFLQFKEYLTGIKIKDVEHQKGVLQMRWVGFEHSHDYNDEDNGRFAHINYLRDYFDYPMRFYYFRIEGLNNVMGKLVETRHVQIDFHFKQAPPTGYKPENEHLHLNTIVAQNLFDMTLEGVDVDKNSYEHELTPDSERVDQEVCSVTEVLAIRDTEEEELRPYYRFQHHHIHSDRQWFYALRREGDSGHRTEKQQSSRWRTYIRFIDSNHLGPGALEGWDVSVRARCTNGAHAQKLLVGDLEKISGKYRDILKVKNITRSSPALWPKLTGEAEWQFLAHLALDYSEFHNEDTLGALLNLYILRDEGGLKRRKVEGIKPDKPTSDYIIRNGGSIPGEKLKLTVDASYFKNALGDIALFTYALGHFLKAYTSINSFLRLEVHEPVAGVTFSHTAWGED